MRLRNLDEGSLSGAIKHVKAMKAEGMDKAEAHYKAKKMGIHAKVVDDIFDNMNEAADEVYTVYINGKKWKAFNKEETANKAAATIAAKGKKTEVKAGPAPVYKPREYTAPKPKPQDPKQKAAMDKALASIDATFGPEQRAISDQVLAMARTAKMLQDPKWANRAWGNVEPYGIKNVKDLKQELTLMRKNQKEVMDADTENLNKNPESNIKHIDRALASLDTNETISEMPAMTLHGPDGFGLTQYSGDEYALVGGFRDGASNAGELRLKYQIYSHAEIEANDGNFEKGEIGYCVVRVASDDGPDQGEILGLIDIELKPKYRKSGHGKKIVRDIVDTTKSGNLDIHDIQKKAKKFWDKMGVEYDAKKPGAKNAVLRKQPAESIEESEVGMTKEDLESILVSMQHDINEKELLSIHKDQLIQQHNEIMEIYERLESGELTEQRLDEVLPIAALAWSGARMAAGAALRSAAGQALKRGAIQGGKRLASKVKNTFKRGKRGKNARNAAATGADLGGNRQYGDLDLTTNRSQSADTSGLSAADSAIVAKGYK